MRFELLDGGRLIGTFGGGHEAKTAARFLAEGAGDSVGYWVANAGGDGASLGESSSLHLFLEYSTLGVRTRGIRRKVRGGLETYRAGFLALAEEVLPDAASPPADASTASTAATLSTAEGLAGVAVSLAHGCALQAVIDPKRFDAHQHFDAAAGLLDGWRQPPNGRQSMDAP